ncbi:MAG: endonuclease/exonuclease/phosphatase family protein [Pricia sp.]
MKTRILIAFLTLSFTAIAQQKQYKIRTIAFYNVENLFDTENDTLIFDDDRTPEGKDHWTLDRYQKKLDNISMVLSEIGSDLTKTSPDIIGICEVENLKVIEDLVNHKNLLDKDYGIVHFDSPDERGIDVALLYKRAAFLPTSFASHRLLLINNEDERNYTRDQLIVGGLLDNEQYYFSVNHWPSRSGGEARSKPNRMAAAKLNRRIIDSIVRQDHDAKIISMGDLNDDPTDDSMKKVLKTKGELDELSESNKHSEEKSHLEEEGNSEGKGPIRPKNQNEYRNQWNEVNLFNPMEKLYRKGIGSLAYRDKWNLFDQIFFTENLLNRENGDYRFWKAGVFNAPYLVSKKGQYKGYPFRTYAGGSYTGGYSDHFPVYIYLIKEIPPPSPPKEGE